MSYVRAQKLAKRLKQERRVSGADILRQELDLDENMDGSLIIDNDRRNQLVLDNSIVAAPTIAGASGIVAAANMNGNTSIIAATSGNGEAPSKISRLQMSSADFEEWIKLATDNKINSTNSWNFALIDYFHEMSLLKEGDNINFQKASATLDGCVKIYSSRVDSIATETGRLLTGLATKKSQEVENEQAEDNVEDENDENNLDGSKKKAKLNKARVVDSTLVNFELIKMKKLDQELEIDPLFKRALSEFDEGGAKSLLLNILNINTDSRIVFDAAGKADESKITIKEHGEESEDVSADEEESQIDMSAEESQDDDAISMDEEELQSQEQAETSSTDEIITNDIPTEQNEHDVMSLGEMVYSTPEELSNHIICPSMKSLELVLQDINQAKTLLGDVNAHKEGFGIIGHVSESRIEPDHEEEAAQEFFDFDVGGDEVGGDDSIGSDNIAGILEENNEDVINDVETAKEVANNGVNDEEEGDLFMDQMVDKGLMAYFDQNIKGINWAGPEHWKVSALKLRAIKQTQDKTQPNVVPKKKKTEFKIDFLNDIDMGDDFEEKLFKTGKVDLPKAQQTSENHNLLPQDLYFGSERLLRLFCKPENVRSLRRKNVEKPDEAPKEEPLAINEAADENYWANKYKEEEKQEEKPEEDQQKTSSEFFDGYEDELVADYADFEAQTQEDNEPLQDIDGEIPSEAKEESSQKLSIGDNLITGARRLRPDYVNFSRTAKRVDVKFLKNNLWKSVNFENDKLIKTQDQVKDNKDLSQSPVEETESSNGKRIKFTSVVNNIKKMYTPEEKKDLSTSFCFICMLHLANEHGLTIENEEDFEDLKITYNDQPVS